MVDVVVGSMRSLYIIPAKNRSKDSHLMRHYSALKNKIGEGIDQVDGKSVFQDESDEDLFNFVDERDDGDPYAYEFNDGNDGANEGSSVSIEDGGQRSSPLGTSIGDDDLSDEQDHRECVGVDFGASSLPGGIDE